MKASEIIDFSFPQQGYGPSIKPTKFGERLYEVNREEIGKYERISEFVADWFGSKDVRYLEQVATAYFISSKHPRESLSSRAKRLTCLKPHIELTAAERRYVLLIKKERKQENYNSLQFASSARGLSSCQQSLYGCGHCAF
jgi:hypothetical protein